MIRIIYQDRQDERWHTYKCPLGGREEFDLVESVHKCRWLVNKGAKQAIGMRGAEIVTHWEWNAHQRGAVRKAGPDP